MQNDFEAMGGTYRQEGDYLLPYLEVPKSPRIGIWGERRRKYLQRYQKPLYTAMLLGDTLNAYLEEVDKSASEMYDRLINQLKQRDGVTENLKAADQLEWVQRMNAIYHEAEEVVKKELVFQ